MKNIVMMILGVGLALSAFAGQPKLASGTIVGGAPAKVVVVRPYTFHPYGFGYYPYRFAYSPFYSPYFGYNAFYYPYGYRQEPSKLDLEISEINNDYHHQIAEVRHDKTLSKADRKQKIRDLRHDRENGILEAKEKYYDSKDTQ